MSGKTTHTQLQDDHPLAPQALSESFVQSLPITSSSGSLARIKTGRQEARKPGFPYSLASECGEEEGKEAENEERAHQSQEQSRLDYKFGSLYVMMMF